MAAHHAKTTTEHRKQTKYKEFKATHLEETQLNIEKQTKNDKPKANHIICRLIMKCRKRQMQKMQRVSKWILGRLVLHIVSFLLFRVMCMACEPIIQVQVY